MPELTPEQSLAVQLDAPCLLVSASAGTGKTHVLTNRYLRLVLEEGVEVRQILAVTFTEAAAAEMRARIAQALRSRLEAPTPSLQAKWLSRQLLLLERAPICTLHSFCLRVVREFFFLLDLDPEFSVLDAAEAEVLKRDALEETLERWFERQADFADDAFCRLVDEYGGLLAGEALPRLLLDLHDFCNTLPDPEEWWHDVLALYDCDGVEQHSSPRLAQVWEAIPSDRREEARQEFRQLAGVVRVLHALYQDHQHACWQRKQTRACLDFDDLEHLAWKLLSQHRHVCRELRQRFRHILVDEYQDINPLQNAILQQLHGDDAEPGASWFMVGDVKQSIYGFRLACPALFEEKLNRFHRLVPQNMAQSGSLATSVAPRLEENAPGVWLALTANFRSRRTIIEVVNSIFERIAQAGPFGMRYDESARLCYAATYYERPGAPADLEEPVTLHLLPGQQEDSGDAEDGQSTGSTSELADWERLEREAAVAALLIEQWIGNRRVWDGQLEKFRPAEFRDVAILMRTVQGRAETVVQALRQQGIPVHAELRRGFWDALEIRDMLALLELLRNPFDDVPLAAVLRSPIVGISVPELAQIRLGQRDGPFYLAVYSFSRQYPESELGRRLDDFLHRLEKWRTQARRQSVARLLWNIYRETGYLAFVQGLPDGAARLANLILLHDRARQFEASLGGDLERFLHYLERLRQYEQDFGSASVASPADNAVRIMSIHQSKGLEFPIVLVLDLGSVFNEESLRRALLFHRDLLLGAKLQDSRGLYRWPSCLYEQLQQRLRADLLAEELRLLYVAMTRARECLALVGTLNRFTQPGQNSNATENRGANFDESTASPPRSENQTPVYELTDIPQPNKIRCPLQWLLPVFATCRDESPVIRLREWSCEEIAQLLRARKPRQIAVTDSQNQFVAPNREASTGQSDEPKDTTEIVNRLLERINRPYPHQAATRLPGKTTPTRWRLWLQWDAETVTWPSMVYRLRNVPAPGFASLDRPELSGAERGQLTHRVLRYLQIRGRPVHQLDELRRQLEQLKAEGVLSEAEATAVDLQAIAAFFDRPLGRRLMQARRILCEVLFSLMVPANEMPGLADPSSSEPDATSTRETVLVQGAMDVLFWETTKSGPVLLDYKTDPLALEEIEQALETYKPQLALYARAVAEALRHRCCEVWIAFLTAGQDVRLE